MDPQFRGYYDPAQTEYYYQQEQESYIRPDISFESTHDLYTQAQLQRAQEINLQQHYQLQDIDRSLAALSNQESPEEKWPMANKHIFTSREQLTPSHDKSELRVSYPVGISPFHPKLHYKIYTEPPLLLLSPTLNEPCFSQTLEMSAGDLLNRTHEELVLLLIQLRRQNSNTARSIEQCCTNIHDNQVTVNFSIKLILGAKAFEL